MTTGTALRGEIIIGDLKYSSGPNHSLASINLADNLKELGLEIGRFKTGTPPRVKASFYQLRCDRDSARGMKRQITSLILHVTKIMSRTKCHVG